MRHSFSNDGGGFLIKVMLFGKRIIWSNHYFQDDLLEEVQAVSRERGLRGHINNHRAYSNEILEVIAKGLWRKIGDGSSTLFWEHKWVDESTLKVKYPRLYQISNQRNMFIFDMDYWDGQM